MSNQSKVRPEIALAVAIGAAVVFGLLIKKFKIGLIIGIFISLLYVLIASAKKKK
jgi:hypothetical protein